MTGMSAAELVSRITSGAVEGLNRAALRVQAVAVPLTPLEVGDLRDSLTVVEATPGDLTSAVASDLPYAVKQHEDLSLRHDDGQAKYLEAATLRSVDDVQKLMAGAALQALEG